MVTFNRYYAKQGGSVDVDPEHLRTTGPIVPVEVSIPSALALYFVEKNSQIPTATVGYALIDTGASISGIDRNILSKLGVNPVGTEPIPVYTPGGVANQYLYPARLSFPGTKLPTINYASVFGVDLLQQGIIALIGRDILRHCVFIYNGLGGHISVNLELPESWQ